ncbi:MAG: serine/threonine-protein kinase [Thermomicrobiales bacterium]
MSLGRIGQQLTGPDDEPYDLVDFIGSGAFGEVYRAVGTVTGRVLAAKVLPAGTMVNSPNRHALLNELQQAPQIRHPNVVPVVHVSDDESDGLGPYLMMEYVAGETLEHKLYTHLTTNSLIPIAESQRMMVDIAQGTRAINELLVHRDIKPDNVLVDDGRLRISDFGISKLVTERTRTHTFKGRQALAYMAPEGWRTESNTVKIDVYSVGIVFFRILTLRHPLEDGVADPGNWRHWELAHLYSRPADVRALRADVDLRLAQLVGRMMAKNPRERPKWDEVVRILSDSAPAEEVISPVDAAVELAIAAYGSRQTELLRQQQEIDRTTQLEQMYRYSSEQLLEQLRAPVKAFNERFQHGQITEREVSSGLWGANFRLPINGQIEIQFFPRPTSPVPMRGAALCGGGYLGITGSTGANLLWLRDGEDDHYGNWRVCRVDISGLANPSRIVGTRGLTESTVRPFGFRSPADFYEEIRHANGGMHVFTYEMRNDIDQYMIDLLETALDAAASAERRQ